MGLGLILLIHCPVFASDLHDIRRDVEAYLKAVHVTGTLEDYYYFYGQANESELELEIEACKALQSEPQGSACRDYVQCRWNKRGSAPSFYLNALSRIVPTGTLGDITFRHGPEGVLPHVMVSAKVGSHTLLFFRPIRESDIKAFGALSLTKTDGKEIAISPAHDLLSTVQKDPCRSILTVRQDIEAFLHAVRVTRTLKQHYYFNGEEGEQELEFELAACAKAGHEPLSDICIDYNRCRFEGRDTEISYYLTVLSGVVPAGSVGAITITKGAEGTLPHVMVEAEIGGHRLLFFRSIRESEFRVFGRLVLTKIDGKAIDVSALPFPMAVFESDPCRAVLTGE